MAALARLGLDCENSWRNLTEGAYPIDATQGHLDLLTEEALPLAKSAGWSGQEPRHNAVILLLAWHSDGAPVATTRPWHGAMSPPRPAYPPEPRQKKARAK